MIDKRTIRFFGYFMRAYPARSLMMVLLLTLAGFLEGFGVVTLLPLLELAVGGSSEDTSGVSRAFAAVLGRLGFEPTLGVLLTLIVAAMTAKAVVLWVAMRQVGFTVAQVTTDLRMSLLRALLAVRWRHYVAQPIGATANSISHEAHRAASAYREGCSLIAGMLQVAAYILVALLVSWEIALGAMIIGFGFFYLLKGFVHMAREAGQAQTDLTRDLISRLTDALQGIKPIRAMGREEDLRPLLETVTEGLNDALKRQVWATETLKLFHEPAVAVLLGVGLFIALGVAEFPFASIFVLAFIFYRLMGHANGLQTRYQVLTVGESAFWSLMDQLRKAQEEAEPNFGTRPPPALQQGIRLADVDFSYDDKPVLRGLNLEIRAGSFVAVYGPSGSGKTTIADLIIGLHQPDRGSITVDGVPLPDIERTAWRRQIGYVPQEVFLFHDSIYQNVTLGDQSISRLAVKTALEAAGAWEFVRDRDGGMDAIIGEGGSRLSGGQRQRISIARALVHRPRLLILDEATTALDQVTEKEILTTLRRIGRQVTILAISHQPALREAADIVFYLENGSVSALEAKSEPSLTGQLLASGKGASKSP